MSDPIFGLRPPNPFGITDGGAVSAPIWVDIDGDGDLDAFVGKHFGNTLFFRNTGSATAPGFATAVTNPFGLSDVGYRAVPTFADIDGDGDFDAFVGHQFGDTVFFRNTASAGATAPTFSPALTNPFGLTNVGLYASPIMVDIDDDSDLDAFVGNHSGNLLFFRNTASVGASSPAFSTAIINPFGLADVGIRAKPSFVDIDGDGDLDAFVGDFYGNTLFFHNTASTGATAPTFSPALTNPFGLADVGYHAAPSFADLDGDGDLDAFVGEKHGNTLFFLNTGSATAPSFSHNFGLSDAGNYACPTFADIDDDGDLDAFVGVLNGNTLFFLNSATTGASEPAFSAPLTNPFGLPDVGSFSAPSFADIDADGDLDAFFGDPFGNTLFFRNTASATSPSFSAAIANPFGLTDVGLLARSTFADIDSDGDLDAFVGEFFGNTLFFRNTASAGASEPTFSPAVLNPFGLTDVGDFPNPSFADIDGDGDLDAFIGERFGNTLFFRNTAGAGATNPSFSAALTNPFGITDVGDYAAPTFADINGDGVLDAFVGNKEGTTTIFINQATPPWSSLVDGQVLVFDPSKNSLRFDIPVAAAAVSVTSGPGTTIFTHEDKTVTLLTDLKSITSTNVTFDDTSHLLVGDNTTATVDDDLANLLTGADGDDQLIGLGGDDSLDGGIGNDLLDGGTGNDSLMGSTGNDTYVIDSPADVVDESTSASAEIDQVQAGVTYTLGTNLENVVLTGSLSLSATGNSSDNALTGNGSANRLDGSTGTDTLFGGAGDDTYVIDSSDDVINESDSNVADIDTVRSYLDFTLGTAFENLTLSASLAINAIGNSSANALTGNIAGNLLDGVSGNDSLIGGLGDDTYVVNSASVVIREYTTDISEIDVVRSAITYTLGTNLDNLKLTGSSAINGTGNALNNSLTGNGAPNLLDGSHGSDSMAGGIGDDTYVIDSSAEVIRETTVDVNEIDLVRSALSYTLGSNLDNLTLTGSSPINGTGNVLNNAILGNSAPNLLDGSWGNDTLTGGLGDDTYLVDSTSDLVAENSVDSNEIDLVRSSVNFTLGPNLNNLTLTSSAASDAIGNNLNNVLNGNSTGNLLDGSGGSDTLTGGFGNDTYIVDSAGDLVSETTINPAEIDLVRSSVTHTLGANLDNLVLSASRAINGTGNGLSNSITGNAASNNLSGGYGNDSLTGCTGTVGDTGVGSIDTLTGGFDADTFILGNASTAFYNDGQAGSGTADYALLTDFSPVNGDKLVLNGSSSLYTLGTYDSIAGSQNLYLDNGSTGGTFDNSDELIAVISTGSPVNLQQAIYQS